MSSRSILWFFKKPVNTVNNGVDDVANTPESSFRVANNDVISENVPSVSNCFSLPEKPLKYFVFPKTNFGSRNLCFCQHNWFDNYPWLHYEIEKDCIEFVFTA